MSKESEDGTERKRLKFDRGPTTTLTVAYEIRSLAATIRYDDEKGIEEGDELEIVRAHSGDELGTATVEHAEAVPVRRSLDVVTMYWAEYGIETPDRLVSRLNDYYDDVIDMTTEVKVLILDPDLTIGVTPGKTNTGTEQEVTDR